MAFTHPSSMIPRGGVAQHVKARNPHPYYNYKPLPDGWIRLIQIKDDPTTFERPSVDMDHVLRVTLHDYPLTFCPDYFALSYTWGESSMTIDPTYRVFSSEPRCFPVLCGNGIIRISRNLRDALRRLRQRQSTRKNLKELKKFDIYDLKHTASRVYNSLRHVTHLWIDAICIDQDDLYERSTQVSMMAEIYKNAKLCIVWLGEMDKLTSHGLRAVAEIFNDTNLGEVSTRVQKSNFEANELKRYRVLFKRITNMFSADQFVGLVALFTRPWFFRLWTLQEVALAPRAIIEYGPRTADFVLLLSFACSWELIDESYRWAEKIDTEGDYQFGVSSAQYRRFSQTVESLYKFAQTKTQRQAGARWNLLEVMSLACAREATDPRDMVFGLFAITSEFQLSATRSLYPDYTMAVETVFVEATAHIIRRHRNLSFLGLVGDGWERSVPNLPSWCPDYTQVFSEMDFLPLLSTENDIDRTSLIFSGQPKIHISHDRLLVVRGLRYDVLGETTDTFPDLVFWALKTLSGGVAPRPEKKWRKVIDSLWRLAIQDSVTSVMRKARAPRAVALFFPHMLISIIAVPFGESPEGLDLLRQELSSKWLPVFIELQDLVPDIRPFLPDTGLMQKALQSTTFLERPRYIDVRQLHAEELGLMYQRAHDTGLTGELGQLLAMDLESVRGEKIRTDGLIDFFRDFIMRKVSRLGQKRKFFETDTSEHFGVGARSVEKGDEVWILHGASRPVLLRPLDNGSYEFKGSTYVQGLMDFDIEREWTGWDVREVTIE